MNRPLLVGLTGGIGSGKSTIAKVFKALDIPVFNADEVAKNTINNDPEVISSIINQFGQVYENGKLDRLKMASIVFRNKKSLEKLNKIVHPKVATFFEQWIADNSTKKILLKEAAILIESGAYRALDKVVVVTAPKALRIQRTVSRDNTTEQKVKDRMNAQLSDEQRQKFADYTIDNGGSQLVIPQVLELYKELVGTC